MKDTMVIGGKEVEIIFRYVHYMKFMGVYNRLIEVDRKLQAKGQRYNFDYFVFRCIWKCIPKKGFWPFKKPFRSLRKMIKEVRVNEYKVVTNFFNDRVLNPVNELEEDREQGNLKAV